MLILPQGSAAQPPPSWVLSRPLDPKVFIGIGMSEKNRDDYRQLAEKAALFDLASEISVTVSGTFVATALERTGLSEQAVLQEIRTASRARLTGHRRIGEWQDDDTFWVYFRMPKQVYQQQRQIQKKQAAAASADMLRRAEEARRAGRWVSSVRFYFQALAEIQHFIGEKLKADIDGRSVFLYNEIYAGLEDILAGLRLHSARDVVPALVGQPLYQPVEIAVHKKTPSGEWRPVAGLPIRFKLPWRSSEDQGRSIADQQGIAEYRPTTIQKGDDGKAILARVDVKRLMPQQELGAFFDAVMNRLSLPEAAVVLKALTDADAFFWHQEFYGKSVLVAAAFQSGGDTAHWSKMHDEIVNFIVQSGGRIETHAAAVNSATVFRWISTPDAAWELPAAKAVDMVVLLAARGKMNHRENAENPFGEDAQFVGEINTIVKKMDRLHFSDRYRGATGWNPMGEAMVMDVLALHAFKRWRSMYRQKRTDQ